MFSNTKALTIPEGDVVKIEAKGVVLWELVTESYKNWVKFSTESDGKTIYNGGLGYKNGYRIRSGGAEASSSSASCTGFIPVKGGDVIRVSGANFKTSTSANAINVANSSFANIGQVVANYATAGYGIFESTYASYCFNTVVEETTGVYKWVAPPSASGIAYIRVTANTSNGANLIVTVNEEITD